MLSAILSSVGSNIQMEAFSSHRIKEQRFIGLLPIKKLIKMPNFPHTALFRAIGGSEDDRALLCRKFGLSIKVSLRSKPANLCSFIVYSKFVPVNLSHLRIEKSFSSLYTVYWGWGEQRCMGSVKRGGDGGNLWLGRRINCFLPG